MTLALPEAILRFRDNELRLDRFANGTDTESWLTTDSTSVPSIQKFLADKDAEINVGGASILSLATAQAAAASSSATAAAGSATSSAGSATSSAGSATSAAASLTSLQTLLNGGSQGQVLTKNSATNLDFIWAANNGAVLVGTVSALKALDTTQFQMAVLGAGTRGGIFTWRTGNYSANITADTQNGIFIKANAIASSAGAWVRVFDGLCDVHWFGAAGDGVTDDTTPFKVALAVALLNGWGLYLPPGRFKITDEIAGTLSVATLRISGAGRNLTTIATTVGAGKAIFNITGVSANYNPAATTWGCLIEGINFDGSNAASMDTAALTMTYCHGSVIRDCKFDKCSKGISLVNGLWALVDDVAFWDLKALTGVGIYVNGLGEHHISRIFYGSTTPGGYTTEPYAGVEVDASGGFYMYSGTLLQCRVGVRITPSSGQSVEFFSIGQVVIDQCSLYGIQIQTIGTGVIRGGRIRGAWSSTAQNGINIGNSTGTLDGITIEGCKTHNCIGDGIYISGGTRMKVIGCEGGGNGAKASGTVNTNGTLVHIASGFVANTVFAGQTITINSVVYTILSITTSTDIVLTSSAGVQTGVAASFNHTGGGLNIAAAMDSLMVRDNTFGPVDTQAAMDYGIACVASCTNIVITDNFLHGNISNVAFAAGTITNLGGSQTNRVKNNQGYNPVGPSAVTVTASPMTYLAGPSPETLFIMGGTVSSVTVGGITVATQSNVNIPMVEGRSAIITYSSAPTMSKWVQ